MVPQDNNLKYFDGYIEEAEDNLDPFRDSVISTLIKHEKKITSELLWYFGRHPKQNGQTDSESGQLVGNGRDTPAISQAAVIEQLLDKDSREAQAQTEVDKLTALHVTLILKGYPKWLKNVTGSVLVMRSLGKPTQHFKYSLIYLTSNLWKPKMRILPFRLIKDMLNAGPEWLLWEQMQTKSMDTKNLWSHSRISRDGTVCCLGTIRIRILLMTGKCSHLRLSALRSSRPANTTSLQLTRL